MASLMKLIQSTLRRACSSDDGTSASSCIATRSLAGGPSTAGASRYTETGIGLLAAVAEPASADLRIARQPIPAGTYGIMTVGTHLSCTSSCSDICCRGALDVTTDRLDTSCEFCSNPVDGSVAYIYMGVMFCSRECRFEYSMKELYNQKHMQQTGMPAPEQMSAALKESLVPAEEKKSFKEAFFPREFP